jgi:hypothetical protein
MALHIAVNQRPGRHHFRVEHGVLAQQSVKIAAVPVCPVQHRRNGYSMHPKLLICITIFHLLNQQNMPCAR